MDGETMVKSARLKQFSAVALAGAGILGTFLVAGCGGSGPAPSSTAASSNDGKSDAPPLSLPTASIGGSQATASATTGNGNDQPAPSNSDPATEPPLPKEGSPEWLLGQMIVLFGEPLPAQATIQERTTRLHDRNVKLVEMAHEVIRKTHKDKSAQALFNKAVHFLIEARLKLATSGSQEDAKALYDDAQALYHRDPASVAAADAAFAVPRLAQTNAQLSRNEPRFIQEFAIQARLFATRFPKDSRAVQLLSASGQTCELYHMDSEAISCFALLRENFSQTPQAAQATAVLRRLELKGQPLKLGGETREGGFVNIEQFRGKPALIVFWASDSESFEAMLPKLQNVLRPYEKTALAVIGVCLDESEKPLDDFVQKNGLTWTEIFYADQTKRHWDHPLVQYYGVHDIPSVWLVNAEGVVVDTHVTPDSLDGQLKYLLASDGRTTRE
jgi:peroxiredoxin